MNDPPPRQEPGETPGNPPPRGRDRAARAERTFVVALVVGSLALAALVLFVRRDARGDFADSLRSVEQRLETKRRTKWLAELRAACTRPDCACAKRAADRGLDVDATPAVLALAERARSCAAGALDGVRAEALVRRGDPAGLELASRVLAQSPTNPNALYARALSSYRSEELAPALGLAEASERAGRGWSATLLTGLVAYRTADFERARAAFRKLLKDDPDDLDALYNLGVAAQKADRYGEARSSYLRVTRLQPKHLDARHNLAVLTHAFGALDEARHHFEKFKRAAPGDPRLPALEAILAERPEHGVAHSPAGASAVLPAPASP